MTKEENMVGMKESLIATFEDIRRCARVLTEGTAEEELLRLLSVHEKFRQESLLTVQETQRVQKELDASLKALADLETKLFHARRLIEMESKARREAEIERDQLEKKMVAVAEFVRLETNMKDVTKEKLAFLDTLPRKRRSHIRHGNDVNSTGSFLSDLSITQSEDDFLDMNHSKNWQKHRPSLPKNEVPCVGGKRSRRSGSGVPQNTPASAASRRSTTRRSGDDVQQNGQDTPGGCMERICATTTVTIPQDGNGVIRAESTIESTPLKPSAKNVDTGGDGTSERTPVATPYRQATAPPMTPLAPNASVKPLRPTMMRQHNFASRTFIRADTCKQCQKKIRFGSVGLRCRDCPLSCHVDCRYQLAISCVPQSGTPTLKGIMGYIREYAPNVPPMIPALIVHCVNEIEMRGLTEVGIYRVSGSEREIKALKERFLRSKSMPHLANIDVHVLCGCIKDFLRSLHEPLIPTAMWKDFCNAIQTTSDQNVQDLLFRAVEALPQPNRDTLAFLVLHFQRIAQCPEVLMPIDNISRIFGPTIVGYSSADPDQHAIFTEVHTQCTVMRCLLEIPSDYWTKYLTFDTNKENNIPNSTVSATPTKHKESLYALYATPQKNTLLKRKFLDTPPYSLKKGSQRK